MFLRQVRAPVIDVAKYGDKHGGLSVFASGFFEVHGSFNYTVCWYAIKNASFLKTDGSTSQEIPLSGYVQLSLLRPSSELLHPH